MSDKPILDDLDISLVEETPRRMVSNGRARATAKKPTPAPPYRQGALVEPLSKLYGMVAIGLMPVAPRTAMTILSEQTVTDVESGQTETLLNAEIIARAWDEWAKTSPAVRRLLYPLVNVGAGAKVFAAHLPLILALIVEFAPGFRFSDQVESFLQSMSSDPVRDEQ